MSQPGHDEITRSLSALNACGQKWADAALALANDSLQWSGPIADGLSFGLFAPVGLAYQNACQTMQHAASQGVTRMGDVACTLFDVANAYEKDEENNVHLSQGKW